MARLPLASCSLWLVADLAAQVPAHAVRLDPTNPQQAFAAVRHGDVLHVVGTTTGGTPYFVHHARSLDGGRTWPEVERPLAWANGYFGACGDGPHVYVALNHSWTGPHVVASHDDGATWDVPRRVSAVSNVFQMREVLLHAVGTTVAAVWSEGRSNGMVWANRSLDGGRTWLPVDRQLDVGNGLGAVLTCHLLGDGMTLHFLFSTMTPPGLWYQRSLDGGASWLPTPQLLAPTTANFAAGSSSTLVTETSGGLLVSRDQGASWLPRTGVAIGSLIGLAVHGDRVLRIGQRSGATVEHVLQRSLDGGLTWEPGPFVLPVFRSVSVKPVVTAQAWFVHYRFPSDQWPVSGAVIGSADGAAWRLLSEAAGRAFFAFADGALAIDQSSPIAGDAWAHVVVGHTTLGTGSPGSGGLVPRLQGRGLPVLGGSFDLLVAEARPNAFGGLFGAFGPAVATPLGAAIVYPGQPIVTVPFATDAAGGGAVTVVVPTAVDLQGERLLAQALVVDPGCADGFAATGAIETWIR